MKNDKIKTMVYLAMYVAMYVVLKWCGNLIPFLNMPNGGSIELELVAVVLASYHLGWKYGIVTALLSWIITWILGFEMWIMTPMQTVLDYVAPLVVIGLVQALWPFRRTSKPLGIAVCALIAVCGFLGIIKSWNGGMLTWVIAGVVAAAVGGISWYFFDRNEARFGIVIGMLLKYVSQVLSGVFFWFPEGTAAGSWPAWTYSLSYNLWYNMVTLIVLAGVIPLLIDRLSKIVTFKD